jgi:hypothetical protein
LDLDHFLHNPAGQRTQSTIPAPEQLPDKQNK